MSKAHTGFVVLPKFILQNKDLTPESIVLYANLLHFDRSNGNGCYARRSVISKFSNMSLHKVRNAIKVLEDNGIISVCRRRNSLTDVIKITPDCRPPVKEAQQRARKPISKPRTPQAIKDFNSILIEENKNTQENNICPTKTTEVVTNNHKTSKNKVDLEQVSTPAPAPNPRHEQATQELLARLKTQIRPKSYEVWFGDCWIDHQTDTEVHFRTGKGIYVADWLKENYIGKLERITGKQVKVTS